MKKLSLSHLLHEKKFPHVSGDAAIAENERQLNKLQLEMLRIQQGVWHRKGRAIIVFEGFDAAGKGGAIRRLTEKLDPRGALVHPIGPPSPEEQGRHWLYRFWQRLPLPGTIAIFDRSWYGRVLVERVDKLIPKSDWKRAYTEITEFERMLTKDGIHLVKFFLAIHKNEQFKRFEERLNDPYKNWKLTKDDVRARRKWDDYVEAVDDALRHTHTKNALWNLVPADDKRFARIDVLKRVTSDLDEYGAWMRAKAVRRNKKTLAKALQELSS